MSVPTVEYTNNGSPATTVKSGSCRVADEQKSRQKDVAAGRAPELDAIAGPILRGGEEHGIDAPATGFSWSGSRRRSDGARTVGRT